MDNIVLRSKGQHLKFNLFLSSTHSYILSGEIKLYLTSVISLCISISYLENQKIHFNEGVSASTSASIKALVDLEVVWLSLWLTVRSQM